jgi:phosphoenolpyruvate synthase/pyruvate phosphate dikinase
MNSSPFIKWFADTTIDDVPLVGGKNASLCEMVRDLTSKGIKVPDGFAVTAEGYRHFIREAGLDASIRKTLDGLDTRDTAKLEECGHAVRQAILDATLPADLQQLISESYLQLQAAATVPIDVAVRSSATAEDLPDASFVGQQETYLNVRGIEDLLRASKRCFASLFTDRAISYRVDKGFDHFKLALSIGVQRMVRSDLACSGVIFTIDTESGFPDAMIVSAAYGLGENVVQGSVTPDEYTVFKTTLKTGHRPILQKTIGSKEFKLVYDSTGGKMVKTSRWLPVIVSGSHSPMTRYWNSPAGLASWRTTTQKNAGNPCQWIWNGQRMATLTSFSSSRHALKPCSHKKIATFWRPINSSSEEMGLTNLKVMIPFCRTINEARRVQPEMAKHGLRRGEDGLEIYVMCEIPINVILAGQRDARSASADKPPATIRS